jgi:hypothetical protein
MKGTRDDIEPIATYLIDGYIKKYEKDDVDVLEEYIEYKMHLNDFVCIVDGICRCGGEYFVLEHKTTSIPSIAIKKLDTDSQYPLYVYAASQITGLNIKGAIYNYFVTPRIRQKQKETSAEFKERQKKVCLDPSSFFRVVKYADDSIIAERLNDMKEALGMIAASEEIDCYPRNLTSCYDLGGCRYYDVCHGMKCAHG